ncbi:MAG: Flp pilus assembly protein TadG [Gammaproteobacteria bacterium]|jgi:Flp pilus assembly protein TadG
MRGQRGAATVEMAIAGTAFFLVLFAALEVGRLSYTMHGLTEATRRGARIATVCPLDDPQIKNAATFHDPISGAGGLIPVITPDKVTLAYLDANGNSTATFLDIRYVRVSIVPITYTTIIPGAVMAFTLPAFSTTLPRESLGVPRDGVVECAF